MSKLDLQIGRNVAYTHTLHWFQRLVDMVGNSLASPTVITTTTDHGLRTNDWAVLYDTTSFPNADNGYQVTRITATTFSVPLNVDLKAGIGGKIGIPFNLSGYTFSGTVSFASSSEVVTTTGRACTKAGSKHVRLFAELPENLIEFKSGQFLTVEGSGIVGSKILDVGKIDTVYPAGGYVVDILVEGMATTTIDEARCDAASSPLAAPVQQPLSFVVTPLIGRIAVTFPRLPVSGTYDFNIYYQVGSSDRQLFICDSLEVSC